MRILYITSEVPYPLTSGFLRHYHFLKALGKHHSLTHLSLTRKPSISPEAIEALQSHAERVMIFGAQVPCEPWAMATARLLPCVGLRTQRVVRLRQAARQMKRAVQQLTSQEPYDLVFFSGKDTLPAIADLHDMPIVIDFCDATSLRIWSEMLYSNLPRRLWLLARYLEVRCIERALVKKSPHLIFASVRDQAAILGLARRGEIIPQAVDLGYWTRRPRQPDPNSIVFGGAMNYPPNHDAALYLIEKILPIVKQSILSVHVYIVGRDPLPRLLEAARRCPEVTVTGWVDDMRPYLESATAGCAPLRFASGVQNKVLEALAMEVPMVTTPAAADGLRLEGVELPLLVGRHEHELAAGVVRLLRHGDERARLAAEGRRFVEKHFGWARSIEKLESVCASAVAEFRSMERTAARGA